MPQSKLQKTDSYQPVVALFPLLPAVLLCSFSLSAASPSLDQCVQKSNRNGAYYQRRIDRGVCKFSHINPAPPRTGVFYAEANPDLPFYQGTLVGMND